jgi:hypothetical protein
VRKELMSLLDFEVTLCMLYISSIVSLLVNMESFPKRFS